MADFLARVVPFQVAASTTSGTLDVTDADLGTIDGGIVILTGATASDLTVRQDAIISIGAFVGTSAAMSASNSAEGGQGSSDTGRVQGDTEVIRLLQGGGGGVDGAMTVDSLITGGVRLAYDSEGGGFAAAFRGFAILFEGAEEISLEDNTNLSGGTYSGMSGYPDIIIPFGTTGGTSVGTVAKIGLGVACRDRSDNSIQGQWSLGWENANSSASVDFNGGIQDDKILLRASSGWYERYNLSTFDSDGYQFSFVTNGLAGGRVFAIRLPEDQQALCGTQQFDTDTGADSITIDYVDGEDDSELLFIATATATTKGTGTSYYGIDAFSLGAADADGNAAVAAFIDDDGNGTSQSESAFSNSDIVHMRVGGGGTVAKTVDATNLTGGSATLNISTNSANAEWFGWLAIQKAEAAGGTVFYGSALLTLSAALVGTSRGIFRGSTSKQISIDLVSTARRLLRAASGVSAEADIAATSHVVMAALAAFETNLSLIGDSRRVARAEADAEADYSLEAAARRERSASVLVSVSQDLDATVRRVLRATAVNEIELELTALARRILQSSAGVEADHALDATARRVHHVDIEFVIGQDLAAAARRILRINAGVEAEFGLVATGSIVGGPIYASALIEISQDLSATARQISHVSAAVGIDQSIVATAIVIRRAIAGLGLELNLDAATRILKRAAVNYEVGFDLVATATAIGGATYASANVAAIYELDSTARRILRGVVDVGVELNIQAAVRGIFQAAASLQLDFDLTGAPAGTAKFASADFSLGMDLVSTAYRRFPTSVDLDVDFALATGARIVRRATAVLETSLTLILAARVIMRTDVTLTTAVNIVANAHKVSDFVAGLDADFIGRQRGIFTGKRRTPFR